MVDDEVSDTLVTRNRLRIDEEIVKFFGSTSDGTKQLELNEEKEELSRSRRIGSEDI